MSVSSNNTLLSNSALTSSSGPPRSPSNGRGGRSAENSAIRLFHDLETEFTAENERSGDDTRWISILRRGTELTTVEAGQFSTVAHQTALLDLMCRLAQLSGEIFIRAPTDPVLACVVRSYMAHALGLRTTPTAASARTGPVAAAELPLAQSPLWLGDTPAPATIRPPWRPARGSVAGAPARLAREVFRVFTAENGRLITRCFNTSSHDNFNEFLVSLGPQAVADYAHSTIVLVAGLDESVPPSSPLAWPVFARSMSREIVMVAVSVLTIAIQDHLVAEAWLAALRPPTTRTATHPPIARAAEALAEACTGVATIEGGDAGVGLLVTKLVLASVMRSVASAAVRADDGAAGSAQVVKTLTSACSTMRAFMRNSRSMAGLPSPSSHPHPSTEEDSLLHLLPPAFRDVAPRADCLLLACTAFAAAVLGTNAAVEHAAQLAQLVTQSSARPPCALCLAACAGTVAGDAPPALRESLMLGIHRAALHGADGHECRLADMSCPVVALLCALPAPIVVPLTMPASLQVVPAESEGEGVTPVAPYVREYVTQLNSWFVNIFALHSSQEHVRHPGINQTFIANVVLRIFTALAALLPEPVLASVDELVAQTAVSSSEFFGGGVYGPSLSESDCSTSIGHLLTSSSEPSTAPPLTALAWALNSRLTRASPSLYLASLLGHLLFPQPPLNIKSTVMSWPAVTRAALWWQVANLAGSEHVRTLVVISYDTIVGRTRDACDLAALVQGLGRGLGVPPAVLAATAAHSPSARQAVAVHGWKAPKVVSVRHMPPALLHALSDLLTQIVKADPTLGLIALIVFAAAAARREGDPAGDNVTQNVRPIFASVLAHGAGALAVELRHLCQVGDDDMGGFVDGPTNTITDLTWSKIHNAAPFPNILNYLRQLLVRVGPCANPLLAGLLTVRAPPRQLTEFVIELIFACNQRSDTDVLVTALASTKAGKHALTSTAKHVLTDPEASDAALVTAAGVAAKIAKMELAPQVLPNLLRALEAPDADVESVLNAIRELWSAHSFAVPDLAATLTTSTSTTAPAPAPATTTASSTPAPTPAPVENTPPPPGPPSAPRPRTVLLAGLTTPRTPATRLACLACLGASRTIAGRPGFARALIGVIIACAQAYNEPLAPQTLELAIQILDSSFEPFHVLTGALAGGRQPDRRAKKKERPWRSEIVGIQVIDALKATIDLALNDDTQHLTNTMIALCVLLAPNHVLDPAATAAAALDLMLILDTVTEDADPLVTFASVSSGQLLSTLPPADSAACRIINLIAARPRLGSVTSTVLASALTEQPSLIPRRRRIGLIDAALADARRPAVPALRVAAAVAAAELSPDRALRITRALAFLMYSVPAAELEADFDEVMAAAPDLELARRAAARAPAPGPAPAPSPLSSPAPVTPRRRAHSFSGESVAKDDSVAVEELIDHRHWSRMPPTQQAALQVRWAHPAVRAVAAQLLTAAAGVAASTGQLSDVVLDVACTRSTHAMRPSRDGRLSGGAGGDQSSQAPSDDDLDEYSLLHFSEDDVVIDIPRSCTSTPIPIMPLRPRPPPITSPATASPRAAPVPPVRLAVAPTPVQAPHPDWTPFVLPCRAPAVPRPGLLNRGATCYLAASLQLIAHITPLRNALCAPRGRALVAASVAGAGAAGLLAALSEVLVSLWRLPMPNFDVAHLARQLRQDGQPVSVTDQLDAAEVIGQLLDASDNRETAVDDCLRVEICTRYVPECHHVRMRRDGQRLLSLDVKGLSTLNAALAECFSEQVYDSYTCQVCGATSQACVTPAIIPTSLPPYLLIQLNRFEFDAYYGSQRKLGHAVTVPPTLDLSPHLHTGGAVPAAAAADVAAEQRGRALPIALPTTPPPTTYRLTGAAIHYGSTESGHYTALCLHGNQWVQYDDSKVSTTDEKTACALINGTKNASGGTGYVLLYQRSDAAAPADSSTVPVLAQTMVPATKDKRILCYPPPHTPYWRRAEVFGVAAAAAAHDGAGASALANISTSVPASYWRSASCPAAIQSQHKSCPARLAAALVIHAATILSNCAQGAQAPELPPGAVDALAACPATAAEMLDQLGALTALQRALDCASELRAAQCRAAPVARAATAAATAAAASAPVSVATSDLGSDTDGTDGFVPPVRPSIISSLLIRPETQSPDTSPTHQLESQSAHDLPVILAGVLCPHAQVRRLVAAGTCAAIRAVIVTDPHAAATIWTGVLTASAFSPDATEMYRALAQTALLAPAGFTRALARSGAIEMIARLMLGSAAGRCQSYRRVFALMPPRPQGRTAKTSALNVLFQTLVVDASYGGNSHLTPAAEIVLLDPTFWMLMHSRHRHLYRLCRQAVLAMPVTHGRGSIGPGLRRIFQSTRMHRVAVLSASGVGLLLAVLISILFLVKFQNID